MKTLYRLVENVTETGTVIKIKEIVVSSDQEEVRELNVPNTFKSKLNASIELDKIRG